MSELPIDQLLCGDAVELSRDKLPDASIDGIATDPPYGLEFMGEEWDKFKPSSGILEQYRQTFRSEEKFAKTGLKDAVRIRPSYGMSSGPRPGGKPIGTWWGLGGAIAYQKWTTSWATEALRVLKPGASMLVMGGTRTYHRMACGVEDAGFMIKDTLCWAYNQGFPKSQDLGIMFDKRECGRRLERKLGRKPTKAEFKEAWKEFRKIIGEKKFWGHNAGSGAGSFSKNKYEGQTGIIRYEPISAPVTPEAKEWDGWKVGGLKPAYEPVLWAVKPPDGSYIDNVLKYGVGAINVDGCRMPYESDEDFLGLQDNRKSIRTIRAGPVAKGFGMKPEGLINSKQSPHGRYPANMIRTDRFHDGYDRFYFVPKASREERWFKCRVCAVCQDGTHWGDHDDHALHCHECGIDFPNTEEGRKVHKNHRTESNIIAHPTVKPVSLGEHLIKLVTREGQIVADFFCGLGSFPEAARRQNRHYIGFDNNPEYIEIAEHRLAAIPRPLEAY